MQLKREQLLQKLNAVSPGVAAREIMDQSACFVFKDGKIYTFNGEVMCIAKYDCGVTGAVHAAQLLNLLNKMADEDIDVSFKNGEFLVIGKSDRAGVRMHEEILLAIDSVEKAENWHDLNVEFSDAVDVVQGSASKDDQHFNLTCVHVGPDYVEACDGYQATRYTLKTGMQEDCLIKKDSVKSLVGIKLKKVAEGKNWIHFRSKDLQVSCRRWVQDYVDLDDMINFNGQPTTLPGGLSEAVDKAEIFSVDSASENLVLIQMKNNKLRLRGEGAHGWYEKRQKIQYQGKPISFLAPPKLISEVTKKTNDVEITKDRLKIDAGKYVFVSCLGTVED